MSLISETGVRDGYAGVQVTLYWCRVDVDAYLKNPSLFNSMTDWCLDQFGIDSFRNWFLSGNVFYFNSENHCILFRLRWS